MKLGRSIVFAARTLVKASVKFCFRVNCIVKHFEVAIGSENDNRHMSKKSLDKNLGDQGVVWVAALNTIKLTDHVDKLRPRGQTKTKWTN